MTAWIYGPYIWAMGESIGTIHSGHRGTTCWWLSVTEWGSLYGLRVVTPVELATWERARYVDVSHASGYDVAMALERWLERVGTRRGDVWLRDTEVMSETAREWLRAGGRLEGSIVVERTTAAGDIVDAGEIVIRDGRAVGWPRT